MTKEQELEWKVDDVSNALYDAAGEIKEACNNDTEVAAKIEDAYAAIDAIPVAIKAFSKRQNQKVEQ